MSFTTKLRLAQMTGSIGSEAGTIRDSESAIASNSIVAGDLSAILSHMASAIKRIHGADSFSERDAGTFASGTFLNDISAVNASLSGDLSAVNATLSGDISAVDATFSGDISAVDATLSGNLSAVDATLSGDLAAVSGTFSSNISAAGATLSADLAAVNATLSGNLAAVSGTFSSNISAVGATLSADLAAVNAILSGDLSAVDATLSGDLAAVDATLSGDLAAVSGTFSSNISAVGATLSADLAAVNANLSGDLAAVDGTFSGNIAAVDATLSGDISAVDATFSGDLVAVDGNFSGDVVVTGNLTVQGTTTTLDTQNLLVEDPVVLFGANSVSSNSNGGIAILSGSSVANESLVFGRVANDVWGVGRKDVEGGLVTSLADMTLVSFRAEKLELGGASNYMYVTASDMNIVAAGDVVIDPAGGDVFIDAPIQPKAGEIHDLGKDGNAWNNMWARSGAKMTFGAGATKGVIEHAIHDGALSVTVPSGSLVSKNKLYAETIVMAKDQGVDPATPSSGYGAFYVKNDRPFFMSDAGSAFDLTAGSTFSKVQHIVASGVAANTSVAIGSAAHGGALAQHLDVYVNGNLLLSGAIVDGAVAAGADYSIDGLEGANYKFAFGLVADDVVVVKKVTV